MGERTEYTPGTFCWVELTTTDQSAAKSFYGGLLGWEANDRPVGDGDYVYSMMQVDGKNVGAIATQPDQQREAGVPPTWSSYVSVENADATAERAKELGATVHAPPFDVMDVGRMAVIQDPQGAMFELWQPKAHFGAALVNAPGALKNGDANAGGIRPLPDPGPPPHWLVYFGVEDIDAALAKAQELGGTKHAGPIDIGIAKIAIVADPQGAVFALYAGELEP
jgi:predicted enzyme related to lactoylglutathione lyase